MQVIGTVTGNNSVAVIGTASQGQNTLGVRGEGDNGVVGAGNTWNGVTGISNSTTGGAGVHGDHDTGVGVRGTSKAEYNPAIQGIHEGMLGAGVQGESTDYIGVIGVSRNNRAGTGVYGEGGGQSGQYPPTAVGVWGNSGSGIGIFGTSRLFAGWFRGKVLVQNGDVKVENGSLDCGKGGVSEAGMFRGYVTVEDELTVVGRATVYGYLHKAGGGFKIDHPLDPARKYLYHSFVESSEMKNLYDGMAVLNAKGEAVIKLPNWFEALNQDFRYQLTPVGGPAPDLHVAKEVREKQFKIAGGKPGMKVSWQVTGVRRDAFAKKYRMPVEETKPKADQGYYAHPEVHGQPPEKAVFSRRSPAEKKRQKEVKESTQAAKKGLKQLEKITRRTSLSTTKRTKKKG